jgi:acetyl esterase/lipase
MPSAPGLDRYGRPDFRARFVRFAFRRGPATAPPGHWKAVAATRIVEDMDYGSSLPGGMLDLHLPLEREGLLPVVVMAHGGAFIGGDKLDNRIYAVELAARGWAVANINYGRAPESTYPSPLVQVGEACRFLSSRAESFGLDMGTLFLAGDSAGAHTMAQYAAMRSNPDYAPLAGIQYAAAPAGTIRGLLLFCGPYDLSLIDTPELGSPLRSVFRFLIGVYLGIRNWQGSRQAAEASLLDHLGPGFPPAFITDGNRWSFEAQGRALASRLQALGVPVTPLFHDRGKGWLGHEYQFILDREAGQLAFRAVLEFLEACQLRSGIEK